MIGYLEMYAKIVGKNDVYYASICCDFSKPITQEFIDGVSESFKQAYSIYDEVESVEFCSREEYQQSMEEQNAISTSWNDEEN